MAAPNREKIGVFVVLAEIEIVEKVSLHQGSVFEGGELKITSISFRGGEQVDLGLFWSVAVGEDKKSNRKKPEKMGNN